MKKLDVTRSIVTVVILLYTTICFGSCSIEDTSYWRSPDGAIELLLHNKWKQDDMTKSKQYDSKTTSLVIPGSFHTLHAGGIFPPRNISLSVYFLAGNEGNKVEQMINLTSQQLQGKNYDVVDIHFDKQAKGYIHYRFIHTGDSVSSVTICVGVSTGIYVIEFIAPRRDEEKLKEEAERIFNNISILKPYK
jgi:hypothetical protein